MNTLFYTIVLFMRCTFFKKKKEKKITPILNAPKHLYLKETQDECFLK